MFSYHDLVAVLLPEADHAMFMSEFDDAREFALALLA